MRRYLHGNAELAIAQGTARRFDTDVEFKYRHPARSLQVTAEFASTHPGAYLIGNGATAVLRHPKYHYNGEARLRIGVIFQRTRQPRAPLETMLPGSLWYQRYLLAFNLKPQATPCVVDSVEVPPFCGWASMTFRL